MTVRDETRRTGGGRGVHRQPRFIRPLPHPHRSAGGRRQTVGGPLGEPAVAHPLPPPTGPYRSPRLTALRPATPPNAPHHPLSYGPPTCPRPRWASRTTTAVVHRRESVGARGGEGAGGGGRGGWRWACPPRPLGGGGRAGACGAGLVTRPPHPPALTRAATLAARRRATKPPTGTGRRMAKTEPWRMPRDRPLPLLPLPFLLQPSGAR